MCERHCCMGGCYNIFNGEKITEYHDINIQYLWFHHCTFCKHFISQFPLFFFYRFSYFQVNSLPAEKLQEIQKAIELFSVGQGPAKTMEEATHRSYQFWDTQPVPKLGINP